MTEHRNDAPATAPAGDLEGGMSYCEVCGVPSENIICDDCADLHEDAQDHTDPASLYGGNSPEERALRAELFAALDARETASYQVRWAVGPAEIHRAAHDALSTAQARVDAARSKLVALTGLFGGKYDSVTEETK